MKIICATLNAKYIHTNLAIRYLKAYAQPEYDIVLAEYTIKDPIINIVSDLIQKKPDVIGFSCYIWNIEETIKVIRMIKKINPSIMVIAGGPEVTYDIADWMEEVTELDFIIIGEGEQTFKQLLGEIEGQKEYINVSGLCYRSDGEIKVNPQRNKLDLKELPSPYRFPEDKKDLSKRITYVETSRGCPFSCQFCLSSIEVGVRYFDREKVKDDIRYLMENGARIIKFVDRTFNISRSYAMEMFRFLIDEHVLGTVFQFEITADIMRPEVIEFLNNEAPPGLFRFEIGVQSTNDLTNELVMRKQNFEKLKRTVTMVKEGRKIDQHLDLIAGLPEENYESFRNTFNDVFALRPEELQLGFLKMLRGTGLRLRAEDHQYIYMEHSPYEILGNNVLPFDDIIRIKQVEDVLEKYWNDHRMNETIEYLVTRVFETPFDFFQEFGSFWEDQGWSRIGHQLEDLFKRLYQFLKSRNTENLDIIEGLMKYDYLSGKKQRPRKPWWEVETNKQTRSDLYKQLIGTGMFPQLEMLGEKDLHKHTVVEELSFDIGEYLASRTVENKQSVLLVYFDHKKDTTESFTCTKEQLKPA
ncbi:B12-binding domain-containing radical SAM protein [Mesobacillus zeae]|uniref:DUF4080 domain-containing protein n=1 Tax=Mesobacillus zeae TaxID=1917180 RepID=A0A398BEU7_9BACI|nr:B12-binding domain-containing radical SAM protein [Mesobacillus zeae]RID87791.1 DUF4080 domain-containing protein [Mesobacillus zeae]